MSPLHQQAQTKTPPINPSVSGSRGGRSLGGAAGQIRARKEQTAADRKQQQQPDPFDEMNEAACREIIASRQRQQFHAEQPRQLLI